MCRLGGFVNVGGDRLGSYIGEIVGLLSKMTCQGRDSCGIALITEKETEVKRWVGNASEKNLNNEIRRWLSSKRDMRPLSVMLHTRFATHGDITEANAHPHRAGRWTLIHNGVLTGVKTKNHGFRKVPNGVCDSLFVTEYCHAVDKAGGKDPFKSMVERTRGNFAFIAHREGNSYLDIARNSGRPLIYGKDKKGNVWLSSTETLFPTILDVMDCKELISGSRGKIHFNGKVTVKNLPNRQVDYNLFPKLKKKIQPYGSWWDVSDPLVSEDPFDQDPFYAGNSLEEYHNDYAYDGETEIISPNLSGKLDFSGFRLGKRAIKMSRVFRPHTFDYKKTEVFESVGDMGIVWIAKKVPCRYGDLNQGWYAIQDDGFEGIMLPIQWQKLAYKEREVNG